ncbi:CLC4E protein, partial [Rhinopomastus cyanomelas]|nr:CLC4E protein [Rhinopomastus cyanomelas]
IYSVAGTVTPAGTFRPASPESFEDDYDDVSLSELAGGHKLPATDDGRQSQGCEGSAGSTGLLAHHTGISPRSALLLGAAEPRGGRGCCGLATLYVLVALSFVAWGLLFALAVVKYMGIVAELELLRCNRSEHQASGRRADGSPADRLPAQRGAISGAPRPVLSQCLSGRGCRGCAAGWRLFGSSCYCFSDDTLSWADAARVCAGHGGHLVIVDSEEEQ